MIAAFTQHAPAFRHLLLALAVVPVAAAAQSAPPRGDATLTRVLQSHQWTLQSAIAANGQALDGMPPSGHPIVLHFDGNRASIQGACNALNGGWKATAGGSLVFSRLAATMKACEAPLMKADADLVALLAQPMAAQVQRGDKPTLRLVSSTAQTLVLTGEPTLASLHGKPTRVFLEVAPQAVECASGAASRQCLRVREIRYDAQGLRAGPPGPWRSFADDIQGYAHTPGTRNVLRVNRYARKTGPADAPRYIYALDLVVESEVVSK